MSQFTIHHQHQQQRSMDNYEKHAFKAVEAEYREDFLAAMIEQQTKTLPSASMIDTQPEIEWFMRPYLLDFLVDTHQTLKLSPQALFLAVNLVDRYCSRRVVAKKHYQLVGCTALWIASKYEDKKSRVPSLAELMAMCCGVYEEAMFLQMEGHILNTLEWSVGHTTLDAFIHLYVGNSEPDAAKDRLINTCKFLAECSMYHRAFFQFTPSIVARSCVVLASHVLGGAGAWATESKEEQECVNLLARYMQTPTQSLQKKYMRTSQSQVPKLIAAFIARQQQQQQQQQQHVAMPPSPAPSTEVEFDLHVTPSKQQQQQQHYQAQGGYVTPPHSPYNKVNGYPTRS